jgi:lysozyme
MILSDIVVDLSHYQSRVDLAAAQQAGVAGVMLKATQGDGASDPMFRLRAADCRRLGLLVGAYCFLDGAADPAAEAAHFLEIAEPGPQRLLAFDLERNLPGQKTASVEQAAAFAAHVFAATGRRPLCYVGRWFPGLPDARLAQCDLWLPKYGPPPDAAALPPGWRFDQLRLWQHTDGRTGYQPWPVPGIGRCDRNIFVGTRAELASWWTGGARA